MTQRLVNSTRLRSELLGGISDMSLWRWLHDPSLEFPRPLYIGRRRYWREHEVTRWISEKLPTLKAG